MTVDDRNPDISEGRVVWESAEGIQVWKGGASTLIAGSLGGHSPKIEGTRRGVAGLGRR